MKRLGFATMNRLCSICLVAAFYIHFHGISFLVFGEPYYPNPEDYE